MNKKLEQFDVICKIGEGNFGQVFKCKHKETGQILALKKICLDNIDEGIPSTTLREIALLKRTNHLNCIKMHDVIKYNNRYRSFFSAIETLGIVSGIYGVIFSWGHSGLRFKVTQCDTI